MTILVLTLLGALGLLDGAFSGFRASLGRTGLVDHTATDRAGLAQGIGLVAILAVPALAALGLDLAVLGQPASTYVDAGALFLALLAPYAALVLLALAAYGALDWQRKYLASAAILGPFTLLRPYVAIAATIIAALRAADASVGITAALAILGVLLVEPAANQRYRIRQAAGRQTTAD